MKFLLKFAVSVALFSSMAFAAEKMDDMALKAHAIECINSLNVFSAPQYAVQKMLNPVLGKDSLFLELDSVRVAEVDTLFKRWIDKCGDLFDPDVYTPGFFKATPLHQYVEEVAARQQRERSDAMGNDSLTKLQKEIDERTARYVFEFSAGYLYRLLIMPFKGHHVQYNVDGTNLFWNGNGLMHELRYEKGLFGQKDSLHIKSGYKTIEYKGRVGRNSRGEEVVKIKKMSVPRKDLKDFDDDDLVNGVFTNYDSLYTPVYVGSISKNWAVKLSGGVGLNFSHYTDPIIDDMDWYKDSSMYLGGFSGFGGHFDVNLGLVHCSPTSARCYGFGAGYGHLVWAGKEVERDEYSDRPRTNYRGDTVYTETVKHVEGINVYGEYYFQSEDVMGLREKVKIPLDMDMKFLESRTAFFYENYMAFELGLVWSPALYVPGLYFNIGMAFTIGPF